MLNTPSPNGTFPPATGNGSLASTYSAFAPPPPIGMSPLFFTSVVAGCILVILLLAFFIYAMRRVGLCPFGQTLLSPEEESMQRRREEQAKMRRLRCGVPPWILQHFPVYEFGSEEYERAVRSLQMKLQPSKVGPQEERRSEAEDGLCCSKEACGDKLKEGCEECSCSSCREDIEGAVHDASAAFAIPAAEECVPGIPGDSSHSKVLAEAPSNAPKGPHIALQVDCQAPGDQTSAKQEVEQVCLTPLGKSKECSVCLSEFERGARVRLLPTCGHGFHPACINEWLSMHRTCPVCRCSAMPREKEPELGRLLQEPEQRVRGSRQQGRQGQPPTAAASGAGAVSVPGPTNCGQTCVTDAAAPQSS